MRPIQLVTIGLVREAVSADRESISQPEGLLPYLEEMRHADREHFVCFHLDARNQVNAMETVSIGSLNASLVHPREVFKAAILNNAASVIVAHNHPSGDVTPSAEDRALTARLKEAGDIIGIEVLDHLIVSPERFLSLRESGDF